MLLGIGLIIIIASAIINEKYYKIAISLFIFGLLIVLCTAFVSINRPTEFAYRKDILSLNVLNGAEGDFRLGTGHIESEPIYYFYTKNNGMYRLESVTGNVQIKLNKDDHYIECYRQKDNFWIWTLNNGKVHYIITIPENSIISENFDPNIR